MAFVSYEFHHSFLYLVIFVLYFAVCLNFYITYQISDQCSRKVDKSELNSRIKLSQFLKNEKTSESDTKTPISEFSHHRSRRQANQITKHDIDYVNSNNDSLHEFRNEYKSPHLTTDHNLHYYTHHYHNHNRRHRRRMKSRAVTNQQFDDNSGPAVEFFPKPQPTQETQGYVWLTSYSRIPLPVLQEYCLSSKQYCPAAEPGPPGPHGLKGNKGDKGPIGDKGSEGNRGPHGPKGPPGSKGEPGLDGREGLPGEPGLDGTPGRDGKNGQDGMPGLPGIPGRSGLNGTNGIPGLKGDRGIQGVPGMTGLPGPKGKRGPPGVNGVNGIPGIQTWKHLNTTLLIAPVIGDLPEMQQTIKVKENENVRLRCTASGNPKPDLTWRRDDDKAIVLGSISHTTIEGNRVNISRINRDHMGIYACIATNGIPPAAIKKFNLEVTFPPLVKIIIPNQMIGTINGSFAVLECYVEAFPPPLTYWLFGNNKIIEGNGKYKLDQEEYGSYNFKFVLNITNIEPIDYGLYKCITKNERGKTQGVFTVYEIDPRLPKKQTEEPSYVIYGQVPLPPVETPECSPCPECNQIVQSKCKGFGRTRIASVGLASFYNNSSWRALSKRNNHCLLSQIGKPVFYRDSDSEWGSWMRDPMPVKGDEHKYWLTTKEEKKLLSEFSSKESFRNKEIYKNYSLLYQFSGNSQAIYGGSFYYSEEGTNKLVIFNLNTNESSYLNVIDGTKKLSNKFLYTTQLNYMDIATDENGLWVIYPSNYTNNTMVMKFNATQIEYIWNLTIDHQTVGEMFIICGVLYGVESVSERNTKIDFAFDLYRNQQIDVSIDFTNPFSQTNFISYNPRYQKLYTWDKGNQLEYPVRFNESIDLNNVEIDQEYGDNSF